MRGIETPASAAAVAEPMHRLWVPNCSAGSLRELSVCHSIFCSFGLVSSDPPLNLSSIVYEVFDDSMSASTLLCSSYDYCRSFAGLICFAVFYANF